MVCFYRSCWAIIASLGVPRKVLFSLLLRPFFFALEIVVLSDYKPVGYK